MSFTPPNKILKTSCGTEMEFQGMGKKDKTLFVYEYLNGILKNQTVEVTEGEIIKQLTNYWRIIK